MILYRSTGLRAGGDNDKWILLCLCFQFHVAVSELSPHCHTIVMPVIYTSGQFQSTICNKYTLKEVKRTRLLVANEKT